MIRVEQVSHHFGKLCALNDVSFTVDNNQITGLLGLNGAGKTTLMRMIYGLLVPNKGKIFVDEIDVAKDPDAARARLGVLPDDTGLYKRLTARENIRYFGELQSLGADTLTSNLSELIEILGMHNIIDRPTEGFSLGERMKTSLARAIIHRPSHVLLDEPTNGLDVITTRAVRHLLWNLRDSGRSVLFSSHLMHEVDRLCDRVIIIAKGQVVAQGTPQDIMQQAGLDNLEDAFIQLAQVTDQDK